MQFLLWLLTIVVSLGAVSYFRLSMLNATMGVALGLFIGSIFDTVGTFTWLLFLVVAVPLNVASIRQQYLTKPILKIYRKIMPEMSTTEAGSHRCWHGMVGR